jgi:hypothetical protein
VSPTPSGFARGVAALTSAGVEFILVGVGGINFYARDGAHAFATLDLDLLLAPEPGNLRRALEALSAGGFSFETGGEPFLDRNDETILARIVAVGGRITALHEDGAQLDLMLSVQGFSYSELAVDARTFTVAGSQVRVGRLDKLLRSKQLSDRPKDREFLRHFESRAAEDDEDP